jgi:chemotaxis protein MotA
MFVIIGFIVVLGSVAGGYVMHGGHLEILFQITEIIIIGGAAIGSLLISNPISVTKDVIRRSIGTLKGSTINTKSYEELLKVIFELAQLARREGLVALEKHVENPTQSPVLQKAPTLLNNHHALVFFCDTLRIAVGGVEPMDLEELMEKDLETIHHAESLAPSALTSLGDALPGLGIVAAVLGVVITMGNIDQPPAVIGASVAAALVGTFLGILMCYGFVGPVAKNMEHMINAEGRYLLCMKAGLVAFSKGLAPAVVVEYARRTIAPEERPSFEVAETLVKGA